MSPDQSMGFILKGAMDILQLVLVFDYENQRRQILQAQLLVIHFAEQCWLCIPSARVVWVRERGILAIDPFLAVDSFLTVHQNHATRETGLHRGIFD